MRINRFLASAGLGSRRSCEELIRTGQVTINGVPCENFATTVEPSDVVKVGNEVLKSAAPMTIVINKPPGFLCTASDTHDRQTVFDLLPANFPRLFHVGRLDRESEGLLILTNDGDLSLKLTHPRYKVAKEYEVVLDHAFDFELTPKLLHGMSLEEGWAKAEAVYKLAPNKAKVVLRQGLKRQIRNMFYELGYEVIKLVRTRIGRITIGSMEPGSWRPVTKAEIDELLEEGRKHAAEHPEPPHSHRPRKTSPRHFEAQREYPRHEHREDGPRGTYGTHGGPRRSAEPRKPYRGEGSGPRRNAAFEEIPFVTRARRGEEAGEGPKPFSKPYGKPAEHKPWLKNKRKEQKRKDHASGGNQPAKPQKSHPFAKFQRRRDF